jgi:hypothetical protein
MQTTQALPDSAPTVRHSGPPLLLPTLIYIALLVTSIVMGVVLLPRGVFPMPFDPIEKVVAFAASYPDAIRWGSFLQFCSAIPLGIFCATLVSRLRFLGVREAGESIATFGGFAATILLLLSALANWALASPGIAQQPGAVRALQLLGYLTGGPGFVVLLGLLYAGASLTGGFYGVLPKWLMWLGVALAVVCELSTLSLLWWPAAITIPMGRFVGLIWMVGVAVTLPSTRPRNA